MRQHSRTTRVSSRRQSSLHRTVPLVILLVGLAIGLASCGGGSPKASSSTSDAGSSGPAASASSGSKTSAALLFAQCMRSHGVTKYPDRPSTGGAIHFGGGTGINPNSPTFQTALKACQKYQPAGNKTSSQGNGGEKDLLKLAECMRSHGVSNFPDPSSSGSLVLPLSLNTQSPSFQAASNACKSLMPMPPGG
jgi:hypothetical protein